MHRSRAALLAMDLQQRMVDGHPDSDLLLERAATAIAAARDAGIPVVHVRVAFRDGHPEIGARNRVFGPLKQDGLLRDGDPASAIHPAVAPQPGEVVVVKKRVSAFAGGDLAQVLRAGEIDELVLTGIATSGVVLSTLREAADRDFELVVLADACLDADPEVHRMLTEKVFPRQAIVTTVADWAEGLTST